MSTLPAAAGADCAKAVSGTAEAAVNAAAASSVERRVRKVSAIFVILRIHSIWGDIEYQGCQDHGVFRLNAI
ncbi:hypothetical protein [Oricola indica]|uniref:hypothetical protein n=1 Tax=Oricola indica TaxID=2872591 RepID=UPI001CBB97A4|nr:hypothetical protein [Oricola indica]